MPRLDRSRRTLLAACLLVLYLVAGGAEWIGDCASEALGPLASSAVCLHRGADHDEPATDGHHHGACCLCPCHGLTLAPRAAPHCAPMPVALISGPAPTGLPTVDLPGLLRPPIAA